MSDTLLPCPFCGAQALISELDHGGHAAFAAECGNEDCPAYLSASRSARRCEAAKVWNTRAPQAGEPKPVDVEARAIELFTRWKNENGLVCDANPETGHQPMRDSAGVNAGMFCRSCGETLTKRQIELGARAKTEAQRGALAAPPKADPDVVRLVEAARELLFYADLMPKRTPAPGGCSTEHDFKISAGAIWGLDERATKIKAALSPFSALSGEG